MTTQLRRIKPRSRDQQLKKATSLAISASGKALRIDPAETPKTDRAETNRTIARLKQIGGALQELIHLSETNRRLPRTTHGYVPAQSAIRLETRKLLTQLAGLLGDTSGKATDERNRKVVSAKREALNHRQQVQARTGDRRLVKLKLAARTVRVLEAVRKSGHDPGRLIEGSLWKNAEVRDAAEILGLTPRDAA